MLKAGMAITDITPEKGLELAGYPHYPRNNTGVHDPLYAACMYLNNGKTEIAMVTLDLLFFSKRHVAEVRNRVEQSCGILKENIMISCSHTHSGPWASGRLDIESLEAGKEQPKEYVDGLIAKITEIIAQAKREAFDAAFTSGTAMCGAEAGVGGNRRIPGGPHDPLVSVMAVRDDKGVVRGIFVNYTLHPTFIHEWSTVCTADYPAYVRMQLNELEKDAVIGFSQGASGNQSSRYYRQGENFDEAERVGRVLGKAAYTVLQKAEWVEDLDIRSAGMELEIPVRDFGTEEELEAILGAAPWLYRGQLPAGILAGQEEAADTFGMKILLCASADMEEELAYEIAMAMDVNGPVYAGGHAFMSAMLEEEFLCRDLPIPLHDGAKRYYEECGYLMEEQDGTAK